MTFTPADLSHIDPDQLDLGGSHVDFLKQLGKPSVIRIRGKDRSRTRAIVTLLHGNEPSGVKAVHRLLADKIEPATDLVIVVASVPTALHTPVLSHRYLPGEEDFNRCFGKQGADNQERLAKAINDVLTNAAPEAVVDTHNTSAHSEPFAVTVSDSVRVQQICQLFTHRIVVIDQRLGTLIEQSTSAMPIVTVEFGGFMDPNADQLALESLHNFVTRPHLFNHEPAPAQILKHPLRLEMEETGRINYSSGVQEDMDITMINTIDQLNFKEIAAGTSLGWVNESGFAHFTAPTASGEDHFEECFELADGLLATRVPMTLFMATTDPEVARHDCLLYFTPDAS